MKKEKMNNELEYEDYYKPSMKYYAILSILFIFVTSIIIVAIGIWVASLIVTTAFTLW